MSWKKTTLAAALLAGSFGIAAATEIKTDDGYALEFAQNKLFLKNEANQRKLLIGKWLYAWSPQVATPASAELTEDGTMKIAYTVTAEEDKKKTPEQNAQAKVDAEKIQLTALCTTETSRIKIAYTLSSPTVKPDGTMIELLGQSGVSKGEKYEVTVWKPRPFGGQLVAAKGGVLRAFSDKEETIWLKLPGNSGWASGWAEHAGFRKSGEGEYKTELDFIITPVDFSSEDAAAIFRNDPVSLAFIGNELAIRNLSIKVIENAELVLSGKAETITIQPGEQKKFTVESGAAASAILKVSDKSYATQLKTETK